MALDISYDTIITSEHISHIQLNNLSESYKLKVITVHLVKEDNSHIVHRFYGGYLIFTTYNVQLNILLLYFHSSFFLKMMSIKDATVRRLIVTNYGDETP